MNETLKTAICLSVLMALQFMPLGDGSFCMADVWLALASHVKGF